MKKLELLFEDEANGLMRCVYCSQLFTRKQKQQMLCPKAEMFIDFHGQVIAKHIEDRSWDMNQFIHFLRINALSWREIYYKIKSLLIMFKCVVCDTLFVGNEVNSCSFHTQTPLFGDGNNQGL